MDASKKLLCRLGACLHVANRLRNLFARALLVFSPSAGEARGCFSVLARPCAFCVRLELAPRAGLGMTLLPWPCCLLAVCSRKALLSVKWTLAFFESFRVILLPTYTYVHVAFPV